MKRALLQKHLNFIPVFLVSLFWASATLNASNTTKLFYKALKTNNAEQVDKYLTNDPQLANISYKKYISPLFATKNKETIQLLLKHSSNPNILDPTLKISPFFNSLMESSTTKDFTIPQLFIDYDVDITLPHYIEGTTSPLIATIWIPQKKNWSYVIRWFVQQCKNPNAQDNQKRSLLHWAAHYRCLEAVRILLKRNADPNAKNIFDESPFSIALKNCVLKTGTTRIPLIFLAYGADPKFRYNNENLIHFFLTYCKDKKDLTQAIEYLIESGVNPLEPDSDGILPYEKAEKIGFDDVKKLLPSPTKLS